jgi:DNA replication protein DnaC
MNTPLRKPSLNCRLGGLAASLDLRLQEARSNNLDHSEFLELLLEDELNIRAQRLIARRTKAACFRETQSLDSFDFTFNKAINRKLIYELATGNFLAQNQDILFIGPSGVSKSHLAQAIISSSRAKPSSIDPSSILWANSWMTPYSRLISESWPDTSNAIC